MSEISSIDPGCGPRYQQDQPEQRAQPRSGGEKMENFSDEVRPPDRALSIAPCPTQASVASATEASATRPRREAWPAETSAAIVAKSGRLGRRVTAEAGLSHGDRFCLALARRDGLPAWTGDLEWKKVGDAAQVKVVTIR